MQQLFSRLFNSLVVARCVILAAIALVPVMSWASIGAIRSNHNEPHDWIPDEFPESRHYRWFLEHFPGDDVLVASWDGCTLDDPRLDRLAEELRDPENSGSTLFREVHTGRSLLKQLTGEPLKLSRDDAIERLKGWLVGPDGTTSCALLLISHPGAMDRHAVVDAAYLAAKDACGIDADAFYLAGPTTDSVAIDRESTESLFLLTSLCGAVGMFLCWRFLKSLRYVALVFVTAMLCLGWSLAAVYFSGQNMDSVLIMMPGLVYTLAISGCIHQLNYYEDEVVERGLAGAPMRAVARSWQPALLANTTTILGLLSLCVSTIVPVKKFGAFAALGVCLSMLITIAVLPAALQLWPVGSRRRHRAEDEGPASDTLNLRIAGASAKYHAWVLGGFAIVAAILGYGVMNVRTSVRMNEMFSPQATVIRNYGWIETHIGPLVPIETVLRFPKNGGPDILERLRIVRHMQQNLADFHDVGGTISIAGFLPPVPEGSSARDAARRSVIRRRFESDLSNLINTGYLAETEDEQLWRITARVGALANVDYGNFIKELRAEFEPLLAEEAKRTNTAIPVEFTGGLPLFATVQAQLMDDMRSSFGGAFMMIALVMVVTLRSLLAGAVTMLPNVFPPLVVFGAMGWLNITVDFGSMMTISTALGMSVDNELHFFAWLRQYLQRGMSRHDALMAAYAHCGNAMEHTAVICAAGMLMFALSPFVPVAHFGWIMFVLIMIAVVCDMVLLPALVASPIGSGFGRAKAVSIASTSVLDLQQEAVTTETRRHGETHEGHV